MKSATNLVVGPFVELLRRSELLDLAAVHDRDAVAHRERLLLVVGHVDERDPDLGLDAQARSGAACGLQVERAERLVEEQDVRPFTSARASARLLLAAAELVRLAAVEAGRVDEVERLGDAPLDLSPSRRSSAAARTRCSRRRSRCGSSA